jgi:pilus assembly protein Flp/PilA
VNTVRFVFRIAQPMPVAPIRWLRAATAAQVFAGDEDGVTSIEYALIATLIATVIIGTVLTLGTNLNSLFGSIATSV